MSEMVETVKDSVSSIFKGGGSKKKKLLIFGGIGAAVVGVALFMRSRSGSDSGMIPDDSGVGDDTGGSGAADLSGLIEGFGGEIDRLDARIANLGATGTNYTTTTPSPAPAPNIETMAAYAPVADEPMVSTASPLTASIEPAADVIPTKAVLPQTVAAAPVSAPVSAPAARISSYSPAPATENLVVASRPQIIASSPSVAVAAQDSNIARAIAATQPKPQPVAAAKPVAASPTVAVAKQDSNIARSIAATVSKVIAPKPIPIPAAAPVTAGAAITLKKPVVKTPASSPVINSQSAYDSYLRQR